jgi:hypothetical protein
MENTQTTITISKKLSARLNTWKYALGVKSVEQVLDRILKIIPASELENFK